MRINIRSIFTHFLTHYIYTFFFYNVSNSKSFLNIKKYIIFTFTYLQINFLNQRNIKIFNKCKVESNDGVSVDFAFFNFLFKIFK